MRYLPLEAEHRAAMLEAVGVSSVEDLFADIPEDKRLDGLLELPRAKSELDVERELRALAARNVSAGAVPFFVGCGAYHHHVPATVDHVIQRSEFLTSYTPYQPEIAQGTLQYLFEFQTQVATLTGMDVANASMYDGSTSTAEAVLMAHRITRRKKAVISGGVHPQYVDVIRTLSHFGGSHIEVLAPDDEGREDVTSKIDDQTSCVVVQYPSVFGHVRDFSSVAEAAHKAGALLIVVVTEIVALGLLAPPGEMGADIVAAEGQSLGNALNFGGPYVGLFATREKYVRQMPGRLCGETVDADGKRGYVLTLSTREQHIRREKATSNICTNSGLCALAFSVHMSLLGGQGLQRLALLNHQSACDLADKLSSVNGVSLMNDAFFNEFTIRLPRDAASVVALLAEKGVLAGVPLSRFYPGDERYADQLIVAATETTTTEDRAAYARLLQEVL